MRGDTLAQLAAKSSAIEIHLFMASRRYAVNQRRAIPASCLSTIP
jgi:DNA segregation ATPase FtsK/SpoIIIE-like protein